MPGLAGFLTSRPVAGPQQRLETMVGSMRHESAYTSGSCSLDGMGLHVAWVCHPGSYSDCLPVWNETHDVGLAFAGEHYPDSREAGELRSRGHRFSEDDASSIVHLYEEYGAGFVEKLNGTFSGVLWDEAKQKAILFNDRFGLGRVYYHESADGFYFASEAKALLRVLPGLRELDMQSLGELMVCGCTLQDRTLFPGISLLPPGAVWTFSPGAPVRKESYFDRIPWENQERLSEEAYYEALRDTFNRVLPRYFRGRQKVALSLTGGLDSRMIMAGLALEKAKLQCYTFGGTYRDTEDVKVARQVASLCGQPHSVIQVDERFFPRFLDLATRSVYLTDGTMDVSGSVGLYVNRLAREFGPVRMTGNYGSEILRENIAFKPGRVSSAPFSDQLAPHFARAGSTYNDERGIGRLLSFIAYKQVPWHHFGRFKEESSELTIRAPYLDNELVALSYQAPAGFLVNKQLAYRYTTEMQPALAGAPTDRGLLDRPFWMPVKVFEFLKEVRPRIEYRYDYGMPNWFAKCNRLVSPLHLEKLFLGFQKYYYFRLWYQGPLASQVKDVLLDPRTLQRSIFSRKHVERIVLSHTRGEANYTPEIQKLLTVELIHRQLIDQ